MASSDRKFWTLEIEPAGRPKITVEELAGILAKNHVDPAKEYESWTEVREAARAASGIGGVGLVHVVAHRVVIVFDKLFKKNITYQETWDNEVMIEKNRVTTGYTPDMAMR